MRIVEFSVNFRGVRDIVAIGVTIRTLAQTRYLNDRLPGRTSREENRAIGTAFQAGSRCTGTPAHPGGPGSAALHRFRHLAEREEDVIGLRHCFHALGRAPTPALRQPLPVDPGGGQPEFPRRHMVVVQALCGVQYVRGFEAQVRLQAGQQVLEVGVSGLVGTEVLRLCRRASRVFNHLSEPRLT